MDGCHQRAPQERERCGPDESRAKTKRCSLYTSRCGLASCSIGESHTRFCSSETIIDSSPSHARARTRLRKFTRTTYYAWPMQTIDRSCRRCVLVTPACFFVTTYQRDPGWRLFFSVAFACICSAFPRFRAMLGGGRAHLSCSDISLSSLRLPVDRKLRQTTAY